MLTLHRMMPAVFQNSPFALRIFPVIALLLTICTSCHSQNVYLVSVGISDYPGTENDLVLPCSDAKAVADLYNLNSAAKSIVLLDNKATRQGIVNAMTSMYRAAGKEDRIVLFFSGHGFPGGFAAYDQMLDYEDIKRAFASSKSKHKMIFADACFSGRLRDPSGSSAVKSNLDVLLFLSSRHNEYSIETPGMKNGLFTSCLIRSLKGGADFDRDRTITAKELFKGVSDGVVKLSNDRQHPVMWGSFDDEMAILSW